MGTIAGSTSLGGIQAGRRSPAPLLHDLNDVGCFPSHDLAPVAGAELVDQLGGGGAADSAALLAGGQPESYEQMRLSGAGVLEQGEQLAGVDPPAGPSRTTTRTDAAL
jgi:hypothetical protein